MATSKDEKSLLLPIVGGLVAFSVAIAVGLLIWTGDDATEINPAGAVSETAPEQSAQAGSTESAPSEDGRVTNNSRQPGNAAEQPGGDPAPPNFSDILSQAKGEAGTAVRDEMKAIAESSASQAQKVAKFKSYLRAQNDDATQKLAMRHLSKLVGDDEYNEYLADELLDPNQSEFVRAALVQDINSRNRQVMLPVMVEIATLPDHPLKDYANQTLGRYLGDSYSADPETLRSSLNEYIRKRNDDF